MDVEVRHYFVRPQRPVGEAVDEDCHGDDDCETYRHDGPRGSGIEKMENNLTQLMDPG